MARPAASFCPLHLEYGVEPTLYPLTRWSPPSVSTECAERASGASRQGPALAAESTQKLETRRGTFSFLCVCRVWRKLPRPRTLPWRPRADVSQRETRSVYCTLAVPRKRHTCARCLSSSDGDRIHRHRRDWAIVAGGGLRDGDHHIEARLIDDLAKHRVLRLAGGEPVQEVVVDGVPGTKSKSS